MQPPTFHDCGPDDPDDYPLFPETFSIVLLIRDFPEMALNHPEHPARLRDDRRKP